MDTPSILRFMQKVYLGSPLRTAAIGVVLLAYGITMAYLLAERHYGIRLTETELKLLNTRQELEKTKRLLNELTAGDRLSYNFTFKDLSPEQSADPKVLRTLDYARYALSRNDYDYAKRLFEDAMSIEPTKTAAYYLGVLSFRSNQYRDAMKNWEQALSLQPTSDDQDILLYLIIAGVRAQDNEATVSYMKQYIETVRPRQGGRAP